MPKNMTGFLIIKNTLSPRVKKYFAVHKKVSFQAAGAVGLQLLNNVINGSPREPVVPPILMGHLRGSGSVFVGSTLIETSKNKFPDRCNGKGKPNTSHTDKDNVITIGLDAPYAAKLHEEDWNPGPYSEQSGDVGNKFIEKHLNNDKEELMALYAAKVKQGTGG